MLGLDGGFELPRHNGTNSTNGTENYLPYMSLLPYLDGSSVPITHNGIGVGTTSQTNIYVSTHTLSLSIVYYMCILRLGPMVSSPLDDLSTSGIHGTSQHRIHGYERPTWLHHSGTMLTSGAEAM